MGTPVIATAWSGNMDFMTERNSCLVGYDFIEVQATTQSAYKRDFIGGEAYWADPRLDEAARWMRRLAADPGLRKRIGKQAAADMAERQRAISPDELLSAIGRVRELRGL